MQSCKVVAVPCQVDNDSVYEYQSNIRDTTLTIFVDNGVGMTIIHYLGHIPCCFVSVFRSL